MAASVCGGRTDGVDELSDAIGAVHLVLLSLHHGIVWTHRSGDGVHPHVRALWRAGGDQQLVAGALPVWTDGVVVARDDLRQVSVHAKRGKSGGAGSVRANLLAGPCRDQLQTCGTTEGAGVVARSCILSRGRKSIPS